MPPPAIAKLEAGHKAQKKGGAPGSTHALTKVQNRVQKSKSKPNQRIEFSRFPAEIQHMIWSEAMQKPACHTFKFARSKQPPHHPNTWITHTYDLWALPSSYDPSAYRWWKSMLWNCNYKQPKPEKLKLEGLDLAKYKLEKANLNDIRRPRKSKEAFSKLANASFQTGFRRSMVDLQPILTHTATSNRKGAAIDVATDLVILEFERGGTADASSWFEHVDGRMEMMDIRRKTRHLKRVAVHYKKSHPGCGRRSPFQCWCPAGSPLNLDCASYKFCPMEQACFLDCFPNIEEFYYVVEVTKKKEVAWCDESCTPTRLQTQEVRQPGGRQVRALTLKLRTDPALPLEAMGDPRDCLIKVMDIYKGKKGDETFENSLEQRNKVKFGVMVSYNLPK
ncbi:hypothetical protein INS49_004183 [Diaporthe citri]|uniref:uncharacterized protein n=1 Tax=Diaporthe citri TaxID=83186 RepID=UPI001C80C7D5|nr:uncharacterized protein INS49_004183 [Diaporthe citri]KAG6355102.1 hypothetical protein INS49_004183 [Diaporthe citri]